MEPDPDEHLYPGEEDLIWKDDDNQRGNKPKGLYSKTGETARSLLSTQTQCALFCGGKKCKYCSGEGWAEDETVIKGLYSQWVTDNMLAMARPSTYGVENHDLVKQFQDNNINTIINLQMPGEHADCGPNKLDDSGFLYNPQTFMEKGIYFYNFGWEDYGVASLSTILDIVKVMQFSVSVGKVAVHCHAGRGRTGVIIACYLVFTNRITGREAIHYVREKRPQSIQTRQQMQVIEEFEMYLKPFRTVFASRGDKSNTPREKGSHEFSLQQFLNRQRHILHGYEARRLKYIPKVVYIVSERLLELARKGSSLQSHLNRNQPKLTKTFSNLSVTSGKSFQPLEGPQMKTSSSSSNLSSMGKKKRRFKPSLASTRHRYKSVSMEDLSDTKLKELCDGEDNSSGESSNSFALSKNDDDDDIVWGSSTVDLKSEASEKESGRKIVPLNSRVSDLSRGFDDASSMSGTITWSIDQSIVGEMSEDYVKEVSQALYDDKNYTSQFALRYESLLNETDNAWLELAKESNPHVLCQLLWDWFDQLKEPVLRAQDLNLILNWLDEPTVGIQKLEKGVRFTIEYLLKVIAKLKPMEESCLGKIYEKLLSHLTHQWVVNTRLHGGLGESLRERDDNLEDREHWKQMPENMSEDLFHFCRNLQDHVDTSRKSKS